MKHVTFAKPMAPYSAGDKALLPDGEARRLHKEGCVSHMADWPPPAETRSAAAPVRPVRATPRPVRPAGAPDQRKAT